MKTKHSIEFNVDYFKLIQVILYIIQKNGGKVKKYNLMKILFEADKLHMLGGGRPVTGVKYYRRENGTVPVEVSNIVDGKREAVGHCLSEAGLGRLPFKLITESEEHIVVSQKKPDREEFSESDEEAMDKGVEKYGGLSFQDARDKNHKEKCWQKTSPRGLIDFRDIVDGDKEIIDYLEENSRSILL